MKKRIKSRLSSDITLVFLLSIVICFVGAAVSLDLFYGNFTQSLYKLNEEPIATITFKYKTAQRKFLGKSLWDRLKQESPVYNGDTIHTSNLSEATIWFEDGNVMELGENTMAQVFLNDKKDKGLKTELFEGDAFIDSTSAKNSAVLSSNGVEVVVGSGSSLSASNSEEGGVSLQVVSGTASVDGSTITQGDQVNVDPSKAITTAQISVQQPKTNSKILYHTVEDAKVPFNWTAFNVKENESVVLLVAEDKDFKKVVNQVTVTNISNLNVSLKSGVYYWKVFVQDNDNKSVISYSSGRLQVIQSLPPKLITPVPDYEYSFRVKNPAVRFIWSDTPFATSYKLVVSKNRDLSNPVIEQRSSSSSSIISTLNSGVYFWQVTPYYSVNKAGFEAPSEVGRFSISKKGSLSPALLYVPSAAGFVNTDPQGRVTTFSWKNELEAANYIFKISSNEDMRSVVVTENVSGNFYKFDPSKTTLADGKYYWSVSYRDTEDNVSPVSEVREFYAHKGELNQYTIEPQDNYYVAQSLLPDTKFTWKKSLTENFVTEFQVSTTPQFDTLVVSEENGKLSAQCSILPIGEYYWRIKSVNKSNGMEMVTSPKKLNVLGPLPKAELVAPTYRAVVRENMPYEFKWNPVEEADYYKFFLYRASDNSLVHEDTVYGNSLKLEMYSSKFIDKAEYRYEVQARAMAVPGVRSRFSGQMASRSFKLIKLKPVEVVAPKKGAVIDGYEAIKNPSVLKWSAVDSLKKAQVVVYRKIEVKKAWKKYEDWEPVITVPSDENMAAGKTVAPNEILLDTTDGLEPGQYKIIVNAITYDDIDISNTDEKNICYFTITEIPPLPSSKKVSATPESFDADYLRNLKNPRSLRLTWDKVSGATDYEVVVFKNKKLFLNQRLKDTKIEFDVSVLENGKFTWTVEALNIDKNRKGELKVFKRGIPAEGKFVVDVPAAGKSSGKKIKGGYGTTKKRK